MMVYVVFGNLLGGDGRRSPPLRAFKNVEEANQFCDDLEEEQNVDDEDWMFKEKWDYCVEHVELT